MPKHSSTDRRGFLAVTGTAAMAGCLTRTTGGSTTPSIVVLSGAGLREPIEAIKAEFESRHDIAINFNFGGADTLLTQIDLNNAGDVYVPGARMYLEEAASMGDIARRGRIAYHTPVIGVQNGNPSGIDTLADLTKPGLDIALGDPGACAIGVLADRILERKQLLEAVEPNVTSRTGTVNELVVYLTQEQVDATIIWQSDLHGLDDEIDIIEIPPADNIVKTIPVGSLRYSEQLEAANRFVEFASSPAGRAVFGEFGFEIYEGKGTAKQPSTTTTHASI